MKVHQRRLNGIAFSRGAEGVKEYKSSYPEAVSLLVNIDALTYRPKPRGYEDYLATLAAQWLTDPAALACTNKADVERLNAHFQTDRFNPSKQFSLPLSKRAKAKIVGVFAARGVTLDPRSIKSMTAVRNAAKAVTAGSRPDAAPFGRFGTMSEKVLTIGHRAYVIEQHKGRGCIRITADGVSQRVYLPIVEAILATIGDDPLSSSSSIRRIGELVPERKSGLDGDKSAPAGTGSPAVSPHRGLDERVAALKTRQSRDTATLVDPSADPLAL